MASQAPAATLVSPEEYLVLARRSETRLEYVDGKVIEITAVTRAHSLIVSNSTIALGTRLRGGRCTVYSAGLPVKVSHLRERPRYFSPDLLVACSEPEVEDEEADTLLNPRLLVEVLSPSTADYDHGTKWENYRRIASLQDYLLISQDEPRIERFTRHGDRFGLFSETTELAEVLELDSIGCTLSVADAYDQVFTDRETK